MDNSNPISRWGPGPDQYQTFVSCNLFTVFLMKSKHSECWVRKVFPCKYVNTRCPWHVLNETSSTLECGNIASLTLYINTSYGVSRFPFSDLFWCVMINAARHYRSYKRPVSWFLNRDHKKLITTGRPIFCSQLSEIYSKSDQMLVGRFIKTWLISKWMMFYFFEMLKVDKVK